MIADKKDANGYIAEMGAETRDLPDADPEADIDAAVAALVSEVEEEFTQERLNEFVRTGGFNPDNPTDTEVPS